MVKSSGYFHNHGYCQHYRPPKQVEGPMAGERWGYKFNFKYIPGEDETELEQDERMLPGGMDIFIHEATDWWTGKVAYNLENCSENPIKKENDNLTVRRSLLLPYDGSLLLLRSWPLQVSLTNFFMHCRESPAVRSGRAPLRALGQGGLHQAGGVKVQQPGQGHCTLPVQPAD